MAVEYRSISPRDYEAVRQFLSEMGWSERVRDPAKFQQMMEATSRTVVALEGRRIIGFVRAICDEISNGYISLMAVAPDKRRHGVGREMVHRLLGDDHDSITWILRGARGSSGFWRKMGFTPSTIAMEKVRQEER